VENRPDAPWETSQTSHTGGESNEKVKKGGWRESRKLHKSIAKELGRFYPVAPENTRKKNS